VKESGCDWSKFAPNALNLLPIGKGGQASAGS